MNKFLILCVMIFMLLLGVLFYVEFGVSTPTASVSQSTQPEATSGTTTSAETEIRAILERYYEIARTNDREALKRFSREISAPEYEYTSELGVMDKEAAF